MRGARCQVGEGVGGDGGWGVCRLGVAGPRSGDARGCWVNAGAMGRRMRLVDLAGVFRGTEALAAGIVTTEQLRGPGVRRLFRDVYLPAGMRFTHRCDA